MHTTIIQLLVIIVQYLNVCSVWIIPWNQVYEIRLVSNRKVMRSGESLYSVRTNRPSMMERLEVAQASGLLMITFLRP
jgi:hypothetical protein